MIWKNIIIKILSLEYLNNFELHVVLMKYSAYLLKTWQRYLQLKFAGDLDFSGQARQRRGDSSFLYFLGFMYMDCFL